MKQATDIIGRIREFNRFYTVNLGMLNRRFLGSEYSVTETRILFELNTDDRCTANVLTEKLHIDKSYMSRILKSFEKRGLVTKQVSPEDGRAFILHLTETGRRETARLIESTNRQIAAWVAPLSAGERAELGQAMDVITAHLSKQAHGQQIGGTITMEQEITIREYRPGDPSRVSYFYYKLFETQCRFNGTVERYFLDGMVELFDDPKGSQMWVAERDGAVVGSVAVVKKGPQEAQLRWFGVDMSLQGMGIGNRLLDTAMRFCREHGYRHLFLWTIEILKPARHLYAKHGFSRTETKPNTEWADHELLEEKWEYTEKAEQS